MHDWSPSWDAALPGADGPAAEPGDPAAVLARYEAAVRHGDADAATLAQYGVLLWRIFEFRQGEEVFERVLEDPRSDTATLRRVAHCYFEIGRFEKAVAAMRLALARMAAPDASTTNTLAWTLERDHQTAEARHYAEDAHALDPDYGPALRLLAHLDVRDGRLAGAEQRLTEQLRRHRSESDWGLRYELAAVCDRLGKYDEAWTALCEAKAQLAGRAQDHLRDSRFIRRRQWELTQSITSADLRRWRRAGDSLTPRKRIAFLTGFPRSGTTLLEQIIASHADAIETDESGIMPGQFIAPLVWKADDTLSALIEIRSFDAEQLNAGRACFYQLTENYLHQSIGERLLIEKNPLLTADLALALRLFPEASLLIALRDPRDVVLSYLFTMIPLNWSSAPAVNVIEACQFYADTMRHWLWWRKRLDWPHCEMAYERMIAEPLSETKRVAEFLGLPWDESMADERQRSERKAVRTPTYVDVTKPLYTRSIGRWKNYRQYLEPGLEVLKPFVAAFGYEA